MTQPLPLPQRKPPRKSLDLRWILYPIAATAIVTLIILSGKLGVSMARERLPERVSSASEDSNLSPVALGASGSPIFLADSPETLRRFFSNYPTETSRAQADLTGRGIRRLQSSVEIIILDTEANAVKVRVETGAIAGKEYWVHHTQLPATKDFDPIISPIPGVTSE